ncbi:hypothetical protein H2201_009334, partial [Coniosporium apollinis]
RSRIRRDDGGELHDRLLLPARSGPPCERQRQGLHAGDVLAGRVHAVLRRLRRHQGAGRALHARRVQGIRRARHFGDRRRPGPDGHTFLLPGRRRRRGGVPQDRGGAVALQQDGPDRYRRRRAVHPPPGQRRLVDHGPDDPDQRRLYDEV